MARPVTIRDEVILEAAKQVFLARGLAATTAEVAAIAEVSEGIIFKRFATKADLFRAAMEHGLHSNASSLFSSLEERVGRSTVREELFTLGTEMVEVFRVVIPIVMMSWSNSSSCPPDELRKPEPMPVRAVKRIASYFEAEMRAGRLRRADAEIVARGWIGALWHFVMLEVTVPDHLPLPAPIFLRGHIDNLLRGLALDPAPPRVIKKKPKKKTARARRR
jgi:AcrR family transcriptional regulator